MINNRQGGRRRGRGGQRPQGMAGNTGNARDNRQRGNAAQLLEKYKSLARDAQLAGDRVQTEYFLQFSDHYFRVLEESRSRFEEQSGGRGRARGRDDDQDDDGEEMSGDDLGQDEDGDDEPRQQQQAQQQQQRRDRGRARGETEQRAPRGERNDRDDRPRREPAPAESAGDSYGGERIAMNVLPPAIGVDEAAAEETAPTPRRRVRKPRDNGDEVAPAA